MKNYYIKKVDKEPAIDSEIWSNSNIAEVNCFPWDNGGYKPNTTAKAVYCDSGIAVKMVTDEKPLLMRFEADNSTVCKDSCMEFFLRPNKDNANYLNFEFNPKGTLLLGYGPERKNRLALSFDKSIFNVVSNVNSEKWELKFFIPFDFINQYVGNFTDEFYGNFYKCGDETEHPHYACWNEAVASEPDFHRPDCFGKLVLE